MKKIGLIFLLLILPFSVYAYSDEVILGGQTIGIDVKSDGVMIVGFYKVNGKYNKGKPELRAGDYIIEINGASVNTITDLTKNIEANVDGDNVTVTYKRGANIYNASLEIIKDDDIFKTGLYVKDSITGIGTLTYIDPETKIFGALGHEIIESNTNSIVEVKEGTIFRNSILSIDKSLDGVPGSKNAKFYYDTQYGSVFENTKYGIFGSYNLSLDDYDVVPVAYPEDVKIGEAEIYTVLNNEKIEKFNINITKINETSDIKNMTIEITDKDLIDKTGGVVQGMSGSPIVQDGKIIGAVTHVIVDNPVTGYGLFITTMLKEGEN